MSAVDKTLGYIFDKDALHRWIDEQPEGSEMLVVSRSYDECPDCHEDGCTGAATYAYQILGDVAAPDLLWMLKSFEHHLFDPREVEP